MVASGEAEGDDSIKGCAVADGTTDVGEGDGTLDMNRERSHTR